LGQVFRILHWLTESKISKFDDSVVEQNITGLNVSVHDVVFDEHPEGRKQFVEVEKGFFLVEFPFGLDLLLESPLIAELVNEIVIIGRFEDLYKPHNVGRVLNFGQGVDLVDREFLKLGA
jgi:hypothetical protein